MVNHTGVASYSKLIFTCDVFRQHHTKWMFLEDKSRWPRRAGGQVASLCLCPHDERKRFLGHWVASASSEGPEEEECLSINDWWHIHICNLISDRRLKRKR